MLGRIHHSRSSRALAGFFEGVACPGRPSRRVPRDQFHLYATTGIPFLIGEVGIAGEGVFLLLNNLIEVVDEAAGSQMELVVERMLEKKRLRVDVFGLERLVRGG